MRGSPCDVAPKSRRAEAWGANVVGSANSRSLQESLYVASHGIGRTGAKGPL